MAIPTRIKIKGKLSNLIKLRGKGLKTRGRGLPTGKTNPDKRKSAIVKRKRNSRTGRFV